MNSLQRIYHYAKDSKQPSTEGTNLLDSSNTKITKLIKKSAVYSILNKVFDLAPPILIGQAVEIVVNPQNNFFFHLGFLNLMSQMSFLAFLTFLIWFSESLFEYLFQVGWRNLAQIIQSKLRSDVYSHLQSLENSYFEGQQTGNLISIVNDDINQLERFLDVGINELLQVTTTVIVIGSLYFYLAPQVAWLSFFPIPIIIISSFAFQKKIEPLYKGVRTNAGNLASFLTNNFLGISTIKAYCAEKVELSRLNLLSQNYADANAKAIKISSSFSPLIRMAVLMGFLATLLYGGKLVQEDALSVGTYSTMIFMIQRLLWPLTRLAQTVDLYQRAMASCHRIFDLLDTPAKITSGKNTSLPSKYSLDIQNLDFSYQEDRQILSDINISIEQGQTIGLVGLTGSGKSTIIKLLLRLYESDKGAIYLGEHDIKELDFKSLRDCFSYVGQDNYLFDGTIKDNLKFAKQNALDEEILAATKSAEIFDFIETLPRGIDTFIGERGQKLSGGQRQRLAIARAILKNAPIFLFDEATSSVDNETEAAIQRSLEKITANKTTIIVAHRLSTIINADKIYVLQDGRVIESGTHLDLLNARGLYQNLWSVQTGQALN